MVNKITSPITPLELINKTNEIIDALGTGGVLIDNETITQNASDELQAVGVIDANSGSVLQTWTGTLAEYNAIANKDPNTLYNVTDDTDVVLTILDALYPVGSIYIGTMSACPLQTLGVGTWQLVATDRVLQGAGTRGTVGSTVNERLPNITGDGGGYFTSASGDSTGVFSGQSTLGNGNPASGSASRRAVFNASLSSSTYQDNAPVQQDAYLVNIWERIS